MPIDSQQMKTLGLDMLGVRPSKLCGPIDRRSIENLGERPVGFRTHLEKEHRERDNGGSRNMPSCAT